MTSGRPRFSLRLKLAIGLILVIGVVFAGINIWNIYSHREARRRDAINNSRTVLGIAAATLLSELGNSDLNSERFRTVVMNLGRVAKQINPNDSTLAYLLVIDDKKEVVAGFASPKLTVFPGNVTYDSEELVLQEIAKREGNLGGVMRARSFKLTVPRSGKTGKLLVGTSLAVVEREARRDLLVNGGVMAGALLLLLVYSSVTLGRLVVKPIQRVMVSMRAVRDGDLDTEVDIKRSDEIGILAETYNFMVRGLRERERLKDAFNRYVSRQVYEKFQAGEITLTGEMREATVLFSDIRSFTNLSEQLTPTDVVAMLNEYFDEMVEIVFKYDGFLNKFIGDALMAVYNAPLEQDRPELRAVRTGMEMIEALERLNQRRAARGQFAIKIGIGINTGPVVAGNIGHERRLEYTVIGDAVNLAQRIESQTKVTGTALLISDSTYRKVAEYVDVEPLPAVKVKGKQEAVLLYAVKGLREGPSDATQPRVAMPAFG